METTKDYKGYCYTLSNENLKEGNKVYPISMGHIEGMKYIHTGFDFRDFMCGFPEEPHTIIDLKYSLNDKGYEIRTDHGYGPIESYFKITKIELNTYKSIDDKAWLDSLESIREMFDKANKRRAEVLKELGGFSPIIVDHLDILGGKSTTLIPSGSMGKSNFDNNAMIAKYTEMAKAFEKNGRKKLDTISRKEMINQLEKTILYYEVNNRYDYSAGLHKAIDLVRHHGLNTNGLTPFIKKPDNK